MVPPKPTKPANYRDGSGQFAGKRVQNDWYLDWNDGNVKPIIRTDPYEFPALQYVSRVERSEGPILPLPGLIWKPVRAYSVSGIEIERPDGVTIYRRNVWGDKPYVDTWSGPSNGPRPLITGSRVFNSDDRISDGDWNVWAKVDTELMQKVGARKTNYGEALAESKQTINHVAKTVSSLAKAALAARKGRWGQVAKELGVHPKQVKGGKSPAAERWLEYQYGWLPLMADVHDSIKLFQEGLRKKAQLMHSTRVQERSDSNVIDSSNLYYDSWEDKARYVGKVFYKVNESQLSNLHQMGLINPLEVAWAVVPYSFVVDWFLPIGNVLEACTASYGVDFVDGYHGLKAEYRRSKRGPMGDTGASGLTTVTHEIKLKATGYKRWKMTGFPQPRPYFKDPFSSTHIVSALALIRQLAR